MSERTWQNTGLAVIVLMTAVGLAVTPDMTFSLIAGVPLIIGLVLYWAIARFPRLTRDLLLVAGLLSLGTLALSLVAGLAIIPRRHALLSAIAPLAWLKAQLPLRLNGNVVAAALLLLIPLSLAQLLWAQEPSSWRDGLRLLLALLAVCVAVAVMPLTKSQAAIAALAVAVALLLLLRSPRMGLALVGFGALAALILVLVTGWDTIAGRYLGEWTGIRLAVRTEIYDRALLLIANYPLTGVGLGCYEPTVRELYPLFYMPGATQTSSHNLLLQVAVDLGIPGLLAYLLLLGHAIRAAILAIRDKAAQSPLHTAMASACLVCFVTLLLHGLLDCAQWANKLRFLTWGVMGLAVALQRFGDTHQPVETQ